MRNLFLVENHAVSQVHSVEQWFEVSEVNSRHTWHRISNIT